MMNEALYQYSELASIAKDSGGPGPFIEQLVQHGYELGFSKGYEIGYLDGTASCLAKCKNMVTPNGMIVGSLITFAAVGITFGIVKFVRRKKNKKILIENRKIINENKTIINENKKLIEELHAKLEKQSEQAQNIIESILNKNRKVVS